MVMRAVAGSWGLVGVCAGLPGAQTAHPARKPTTPEVWPPRLQAFTPAGTQQTEFGSALSKDGYRQADAGDRGGHRTADAARRSHRSRSAGARIIQQCLYAAPARPLT